MPALAAPGADTAIEKGLKVLAATQDPSGAWKGDYGGPLFLPPLYLGTLYALGRVPDEHTRSGFLRYLRAHQNADGGWGLDVESKSQVFTSVLNYVALRLLGVSAQDPGLLRARAWFLPRGGALASASWGKFMLTVSTSTRACTRFPPSSGFCRGGFRSIRVVCGAIAGWCTCR